MISVRKALKKDINIIVEIHLERFSKFFLSTLGASFLRTFYKAFLTSPAILLILEDEGEIKGFAAGNTSNKGFYKNLLGNNMVDFIFIGFKIAFTNPSALIRIISNASISKKNNLFFAELLSIATVKNKKGYGKILLKEFEHEVNNINSNLPVSLTTDFYNNDRVIDFYKNSGYEILETFEGYQHRKMYRFIKNI